MSLVGIIANPASGKDIRRLVARASVSANREKVNTLQRLLLALDALGVDQAVIMPDCYYLGEQALHGIRLPSLEVSILKMPVTSTAADSSGAAQRMREMGAGCIVVLGGDGTNRVVAKTCGLVPIVPISTGTNNVFPKMVEGTTAGIAAGLLVTGAVDAAQVCRRAKMMEVYLDGQLVDVALIDVVTCTDLWVGTRAIWETSHIKEVVLARAEPASTGTSAVGACFEPVGADDSRGMYLELGEGGEETMAPLAPGLVTRVPVRRHRLIQPGEMVSLSTKGVATVALDGEREIEVFESQTIGVRLTLEGPLVVDIDRCLETAARAGVFRQIGGYSRRI